MFWRRARSSQGSALLAAPELAQDLIAAQLFQPDRLRLAASCRSLRRASLRHRWFAVVYVTLPLSTEEAVVAALPWWKRFAVDTIQG
jgi:hypothetical protein